MEPFDRDDFVCAVVRRVSHGDAAHRQRYATTPRRKSTRPSVGHIGSPGALRPSPDALHRASRRACPEKRFAAIKLIPFGRKGL
jgi:hypothetical protein